MVEAFFLLYLLLYASYLFLSVAMGAWRLYRLDRMRTIKNELKHDFYFPVSVLVPAHNEEVTILDNVKSLLELDYQLYEVIVIDDGSSDDTSQVSVGPFRTFRIKLDTLGYTDQSPYSHYVVVLQDRLDNTLHEGGQPSHPAEYPLQTDSGRL